MENKLTKKQINRRVWNLRITYYLEFFVFLILGFLMPESAVGVVVFSVSIVGAVGVVGAVFIAIDGISAVGVVGAVFIAIAGVSVGVVAVAGVNDGFITGAGFAAIAITVASAIAIVKLVCSIYRGVLE